MGPGFAGGAMEATDAALVAVCAEAASLTTDAGFAATGAGARTFMSFGAVTTIGASTCGVGTTSAADGALGIEPGDVAPAAVTAALDTSAGGGSAALPRAPCPARAPSSVRLPSIDTTTIAWLATAPTRSPSRVI